MGERIREISRLGMKGKCLTVFLMTVFMGISGVVLTSSASAINYTIEYKENVATNMPESVFRGLSPNASVLLSNNSPLRDGFRFLGWCDQATTKSGDTDTCASGHEHQPGGTVTLDATANANNIKLYAMWKRDEPTFGGIETMQEMTTAICAAETTPLTTAASSTRIHSPSQDYVPEAYLRDMRDNHYYIIRKLADGNCWMSQNLALGSSESTMLLTSGDSDVSSSFVLPKATTSSSLEVWGETSYKEEYTTKWYSGLGVFDNGSKWITATDGITDMGSTTVQTTGAPDSPVQYLGNYYSWAVAAAVLTDSNSTSASGIVSTSICPKGWRLPDHTSNEISTLIHTTYEIPSSADGSSSFRGFPFNYVAAGIYYGVRRTGDGPFDSTITDFTDIRSLGTSGEYFYNNGGDEAAVAGFYATGYSLGIMYGRISVVGRSIRCIAR